MIDGVPLRVMAMFWLVVVVVPTVMWLLERGSGGPSTKTVQACRLKRGAVVLTPSTPYRYRTERVVWLERQPFGVVVANLEGQDPDTGETKQRWHRWGPHDMVTVFLADVEVYEHGGDYGNVYELYGKRREQPNEEEEEVGAWQRVSEIVFPE
jgi:hypothetical protein